MKSYTYRIIIEPDTNGTFHAYAPALPGCHTFGDTLESARSNMREAISLYIEHLTDTKTEIPQERGLESFETVAV